MIMNIQKPKVRKRILFVAEAFVVVATCLTLLAILDLGPVHLMLYLVLSQPFFIIGAVL